MSRRLKMKRNWHQFLLLASMMNLVKGDLEFKAIQPARCRKGDKDLHLNGLSWTKCLRSCRERTQCLAISYRRSFHMCVLNYGENNTFNKLDADICTGFVYAEKQFRNEVDDCKRSGAADVCLPKECTQHTAIPNGQIHGNVVTIGSKLKVSCNADFKLVGADQHICNDDGQWISATGHKCTIPVCAKDSPVFISARQTSTLGSAEAYLAIDGNVNSRFSEGSCTHTLNGRNDSWTGQLKTTSIVRGLAIYNRRDCCGNRLNDFSVFVGTESCAHFQGEAGAIVNVTCLTGAMVGETVTILQNLNLNLTLCEVILF